MANPYVTYYQRQAGGNFNPVVFRGNKYQRGRGFGNFFSGLFRRITPFLKTVGADIGKQLLSTGTHLIDNAVQGRNMKEAAKERFRDTGKAIVSSSMQNIRSQMGLGRKRKKRTTESINTGLGVKRKAYKPLTGAGSRPNKKKKKTTLTLHQLFG